MKKKRTIGELFIEICEELGVDEIADVRAKKISCWDYYEFIKQETNSIPVILYPGDKWILGENNENIKAIEFYEKDFSKKFEPFKNSPKIEFQELQNYSNIYIKKIKNMNNWGLIKFFHSISFLKTAKI